MTLEKNFYTAKEAAQILCVHYQTVRNLIKTGKLHAIKIGRDYRISKETLEDFAETGTKE